MHSHLIPKTLCMYMHTINKPSHTDSAMKYFGFQTFITDHFNWKIKYLETQFL